MSQRNRRKVNPCRFAHGGHAERGPAAGLTVVAQADLRGQRSNLLQQLAHLGGLWVLVVQRGNQLDRAAQQFQIAPELLAEGGIKHGHGGSPFWG